MNLKNYKAITPSQRERVSIDFKKENIWRGSPLKRLTKINTNKGGRNTDGQISSFHRGGGHKKSYRLIDFKRNLYDLKAEVIRIEYDPNRSAYIALLAYENGNLSYVIAPENLLQGQIIVSSMDTILPIHLGNAMPLKNIPVGTTIHNIELSPGKGGQVARSAGTYGKLIKKDNKVSLIRLSSGKQLILSNLCFCTIGIVSKSNQRNINLGKAGRSRWLNRKPIVRGVVMNPIDHPHGGGEGKTSGGRCSVTPWGIPTKSYKTIRKKQKKRV